MPQALYSCSDFLKFQHSSAERHYRITLLGSGEVCIEVPQICLCFIGLVTFSNEPSLTVMKI